MNTRFLLIPVLLTAAALALGGCASTPPKAQAEFDVAADFTAYKTFALAPMGARVQGATPGEVLRVGPALKDAAQRAMTGRGYVEVADPKGADMVVRIHSRIVPKTEVTDWGFTPTYSRYGWYRSFPYETFGRRRVEVDNYNEGTLIVEVYDARTREMVWVGWITGRKEEREDKSLAAATQALNEILAAFPPAGTAPTAPQK